MVGLNFTRNPLLHGTKTFSVYSGIVIQGESDTTVVT